MAKDIFSNHTFSAIEWSAPYMESVEEIKNVIDRMFLCGRRIKHIRVIGTSFPHSRDRIEDYAYGQLNFLAEEERQRRSDYENIDPDMLYPRWSMIDAPILFAFDDGNTFEIETPREALFRISMNRIPWDIKSRYGDTLTDASRLFEVCLEQRIVQVDVNTYTTNKRPLFHDPFEEPPFEREFVSEIILRLENGCALVIHPWIDYCEIECIDRNGELMMIPWKDLKAILNEKYI